MNRLEWILGIVLAILLVVVAVFSLLLWFRPDDQQAAPNSEAAIAAQANQVAPTSVFEGQTAKLAFVAAQSVADSWQSDAALLNASATWPQGASTKQLLDGETTWSFTFYSPATGSTALISVVENNATLLSAGRYELTTPLLAASGWQLDSKDAIEQFLAEGGESFINNNGVTNLTMMLSTSSETGRIEWLVSLFGTQTLRSLTMQLDATSGEILTLDES